MYVSVGTNNMQLALECKKQNAEVEKRDWAVESGAETPRFWVRAFAQKKCNAFNAY